MRRPARRGGRGGVAAIEFAIVLPVLIVILTSLADLTNVLLTWWRAAQAADAIGRIATSLAVTATNANVLTQAQAATAGTAALPLLPTLHGDGSAGAGVVLTSVVFTLTAPGCVQACAYVAHVAWSASLLGGLPARPCGTLAAAADTAPPSPTTLPASAFTATSLLLVDVATQVTPAVSTLLGPVVPIAVAALMAARNGGPRDWISITGPTAARLRCPGYT
jgi:Flp pilus assembly protein TadG